MSSYNLWKVLLLSPSFSLRTPQIFLIARSTMNNRRRLNLHQILGLLVESKRLLRREKQKKSTIPHISQDSKFWPSKSKSSSLSNVTTLMLQQLDLDTRLYTLLVSERRIVSIESISASQSLSFHRILTTSSKASHSTRSIEISRNSGRITLMHWFSSTIQVLVAKMSLLHSSSRCRSRKLSTLKS